MIASTALALTLTALSVQAAPALELTVGAAESVTGVDNFAVDITLTNTGDEVLKLYNDPRGPLNSFPEHTFSVSDADGQATPFVGAHVKYSFDRATSFTTLAPTESVTVTHSLAQAYNFTHVGAYSVSFEPLFHYQSAEGTAVPIIATTASMVESIEKAVDVAEASTDVTFSIELTGSLVSTQRNQLSAGSISGLQKRAAFVSCSSTRQSQINSALGVVPTYLSNGLSYLSTAGSSSTRYRTWFGTYSTTNDNTVTNHYSLIQSSNPSSYTYDCSCTDDYYAYVYPSQFGRVYLCNAFWTAPTSGTDSKAGTIVHEASHFTRNGGTNDYAYGQSAAKSLATSNPSRAIMNADSHEYFVENTPSLP